MPDTSVAGACAGFDPLRKRVFDVVTASFILVLTSPVMLLAMLAIALDSGLPIFFTQQRRGFRGHLFTIYKFRSMTAAAEPIQEYPPKQHFTRIGPLLRRTCIDEYPQLFNVLRGDMSLVGPRPRPTWHEDQFADTLIDYPGRFRMKPGLTGLAQLHTKHGLGTDDSMRDCLGYDLRYIETWSLRQDAVIVAKSIWLALILVMQLRSAREPVLQPSIGE